MPDILLQINGKRDTAVYQGVPLILSVRPANQRAMNADLENRTNQGRLREIEAKTAHGEMSKEKAEARSARLRRKQEIRAVQLGDANASWEQFVRFAIQISDGKQQPLPWPIKLVALPQAKSVTLDERTTAQPDYGLEPAAAAQISLGDYQVVAAIEVAAEAKLPADRWRGRVQSEPVKLRIVQKPARLARADEEKLNLDYAEYFFATAELSRALQYAEKVLKANRKSIPARSLVGDAKEGLGDLRGALAAYQTATREFYEQYPESYEAPLYLLHKSSELMQKLNLMPGQTAPKSTGR